MSILADRITEAVTEWITTHPRFAATPDLAANIYTTGLIGLFAADVADYLIESIPDRFTEALEVEQEAHRSVGFMIGATPEELQELHDQRLLIGHRIVWSDVTLELLQALLDVRGPYSYDDVLSGVQEGGDRSGHDWAAVVGGYLRLRCRRLVDAAGAGGPIVRLQTPGGKARRAMEQADRIMIDELHANGPPTTGADFGAVRARWHEVFRLLLEAIEGLEPLVPR